MLQRCDFKWREFSSIAEPDAQPALDAPHHQATPPDLLVRDFEIECEGQCHVARQRKTGTVGRQVQDEAIGFLRTEADRPGAVDRQARAVELSFPQFVPPPSQPPSLSSRPSPWAKAYEN